VELGDNKSYLVKGIESTSIKLEDESNIHLNNILFGPSLHNNLVSISSLEDKGDRIAFMLILGSIRCALAPKFCGGARTHEISKTHKLFGEIPPG